MERLSGGKRAVNLDATSPVEDFREVVGDVGQHLGEQRKSPLGKHVCGDDVLVPAGLSSDVTNVVLHELGRPGSDRLLDHRPWHGKWLGRTALHRPPCGPKQRSDHRSLMSDVTYGYRHDLSLLGCLLSEFFFDDFVLVIE
jgi:hypothetical protein